MSTCGLLTAICVCAFDQTAVTAVMPEIAARLGDTNAYSATFVSALAASIIGMVFSGILTDRRGAQFTIISSASLLMVGLLLSMVSRTMPVFLASRVIQGLGTGGLIVAIYAAIALIYPEKLRPQVFAGFAGAWVVPSLVGPGVAGLLAVTLSWHAVFALPLVAVIIAVALLYRVLAALPQSTPAPQPGYVRTLGAAVVLAGAASIINLSTHLKVPTNILVFVGACSVALLCMHPLVPAGTFLARAGTPRLVLTRGIIDMLSAAEMYLPLLLAERYQLGPTLTGLGLTVSGFAWFIGSHYQAQFGDRLSTPCVFLISTALIAAGFVVVTVTVLTGSHWWITIIGWGVTGIGMGFSYPRLSAEALSLCAETETGFIGSALQVSGSIGITTMLSVAGTIQLVGNDLAVELRFGIIFGAIGLMSIPLLLLWLPRASNRTPHNEIYA